MAGAGGQTLPRALPAVKARWGHDLPPPPPGETFLITDKQNHISRPILLAQ